MKRENVQDERIAAQRRKIQSDAYGILIIVLLVSMLVQQFLLKAPLEQYAVEFICVFGMSIYTIVRYLTLGLNIYGEGKRAKRIPLVSSIVTGIVVTAINGILNHARFGDGIGYLVITFISATAFAFAAQLCLGYLNKKEQSRIQKQLDEDEADE